MMIEIKVPELAESISEGAIAEWKVKEGDYVKIGDPLLELETDKINLEVNSDFSGTIQTLCKKSGDIVTVGEVIATLNEGTINHKQSQEENTEDNVDVEFENNETDESMRTLNQPIASPAARKKARELGIDLQQVPYKDPLGRVRLEGVIEAYNSENEQSTSKNQIQSQKQNLTENDEKPIERIKMSRRRQTIAARLVEAQQTAAMLTTFNEVDMSAVLSIRNRRKDQFYEKHGVKLGFMSFFTKAVVTALKEFLLLNAEIDDNEILMKKYYDIGVAVSTDEGLVVPIIRDADQLSFAEIEKEILNLSKKARSNSLELQHLMGGTFTITNGGIFGSLYSTPILNTPQVGILGMHKIQRRPIVVDDKDTVKVRPMMYTALSYDHRIIDGKDAVQFLARVKELLEDPEDLFLEG